MGDLCSHCGSGLHDSEDCDARRPGPLVDEDLRAIVRLVMDLAFYRSVADDGGLGVAAHIELQHAIAKLPEAKR